MNQIKLQSKQPKLETSIFAIMTQLAREHQAINLSQGFPDFDCHPELIDLVYCNMKAGHNQYAPMPGVPQLREAIARKTERLYGALYDPETEITVTAGATEALYAAITATVHPGDEVIVFEPWYDAYVPVIEYNQGVPVFIQQQFPDYHIDWQQVREAITAKTRLIIFNTPHNPSGSVLTETDIRSLIKIIGNTDIVLISDEVYEHIIFDDRKHHSFCRYPELRARTMVISSFGKTCHTTGWKVGYCNAPQALTAEFRKVHQFLTYAVNTPVQMAYAEFLKREALYQELNAFYQQKRDLFRSRLKDSRFKLLPCSGTYFQLADYSDISDETDMDFAVRLIRDHGVASVPVSPFYINKDDNKVIRFCFAKKEETLKEAAEKLCRI